MSNTPLHSNKAIVVECASSTLNCASNLGRSSSGLIGYEVANMKIQRGQCPTITCLRRD